MQCRTSLFLVPFALCAMGASVLFLSGCKKESVPDPVVPEAVMKDPVFRKGLDERNVAQKQIVAERAKLVRRMEELIRAHGENQAALEKIPEWNELHRKVTELNEKYEQGRKGLLNYTRAKIAPKKSEKQAL